jgi:hypothetical protein
MPAAARAGANAVRRLAALAAPAFLLGALTRLETVHGYSSMMMDDENCYRELQPGNVGRGRACHPVLISI